MSVTLTASPTAADPKHFAPDDLLRLPNEGAGYELVNGELKELNMSTESNRLSSRICARLENHCDATGAGWVFPQDSPFRCFADDPDRVRKPDGAFVSLARLPVEGYRDMGHCPAVPDLAIEIISIHDVARDVRHKIAEWLAAGVRVLWEVYPDSQVVRAHRPDNTITLFSAADTLTAPDVLPGFAVPVADLFRLPGQPAPTV